MLHLGPLPLPESKSGKIRTKEDPLLAGRQCYIGHWKALLTALTQPISVFKGPNLCKILPWSNCIFTAFENLEGLLHQALMKRKYQPHSHVDISYRCNKIKSKYHWVKNLLKKKSSVKRGLKGLFKIQERLQYRLSNKELIGWKQWILGSLRKAIQRVV